MEIFKSQLSIIGINIDGEKFNKTSRAHMTGENIKIILDYHNELLKLKNGDKVEIAIYKGNNDNEVPEYYNYVMNGQIFKIENDKDGFKIINASFGGLCLVMKVKVDVVDLEEFSEIIIGARVL
ncbi:putative DNA-directed RNA polymerases I, II, and III subunit RPABC3 [Dictyocoela muelleri]|nr:putative DNA-directed RNA polymerases I, II, and III subunit RPABC3 [Dictyocoela muelleri]